MIDEPVVQTSASAFLVWTLRKKRWSETLLPCMEHVHLHPGKWAQKKNGFSEKSRPNNISLYT
jgi:hypothetical protein